MFLSAVFKALVTFGCYLAEYGEQMCQNACRTCSTIIFPYLTNNIILYGVDVTMAIVVTYIDQFRLKSLNS